MSNNILKAQSLSYYIENKCLLKNISLQVKKAEIIGIGGKSGSGKTTLLHILSGLQSPKRGQRTIMGTELNDNNRNILAKMRREHLGFILQTPNLMTDFTTTENIALPLILNGAPYDEAITTAKTLMTKMEIAHLDARNTMDLSGGEKQRINIARAIVHKPALLFADEPTGSLDYSNTEKIQEILLTLREQVGCAMIIVSHDQSFIDRTDRKYELINGHLQQK